MTSILPQISVIITTYNQPLWLEMVLWGYHAQTIQNFEVIIADDGSGPETHEVITRMQQLVTFPIKHIWHEDKGFRKCTILNLAIKEVETTYVLFSDGDCIPRADFVETHLAKREPKRFLSNGYYKLSMDVSKRISRQDIAQGNCHNAQWLIQAGMPSSFKQNKLKAKGWKEWLLNNFTTAKASWNGHGASAWLEDILNANGFDERMRYGGQDREFGERLENAGIKGKQIRYSTVCIHLDHSRSYITPEMIINNNKIRKETKRHRIVRTSFGIDSNLSV